MSLSAFLTDTVTVETLTGINGYGAQQFAAPQTVACSRDDSRKFTRTKTGDVVKDATVLYVSMGDAALFIEGSRVTVPATFGLPARTTTVDTVAVYDSGPTSLEGVAQVGLV